MIFCDFDIANDCIIHWMQLDISSLKTDYGFRVDSFIIAAMARKDILCFRNVKFNVDFILKWLEENGFKYTYRVITNNEKLERIEVNIKYYDKSHSIIFKELSGLQASI